MRENLLDNDGLPLPPMLSTDEAQALVRARGEKCWCGGEVGPRAPGDKDGLGCYNNIWHDWRKIGYLLKFSDKCEAEVIRKGELQPCDKVAVAVAYGEAENDNWWPVCPHHSRGRRMVPLSELLKSLTT